jgi:hypothetical protein
MIRTAGTSANRTEGLIVAVMTGLQPAARAEAAALPEEVEEAL